MIAKCKKCGAKSPNMNEILTEQWFDDHCRKMEDLKILTEDEIRGLYHDTYFEDVKYPDDIYPGCDFGFNDEEVDAFVAFVKHHGITVNEEEDKSITNVEVENKKQDILILSWLHANNL